MASLIRFLALAAAASALKIHEINGDKYLSPYAGQNVSNVAGVVTAKGPNGIWIRSPRPDLNLRTSQSLYLFNRNIGANLTVGDEIVISGKVEEYRSNKDYIYLTEITNPVVQEKVSSGNKVEPWVIGRHTLPPPTEQFSSLDGGDVFAVPNNVSQISTANPTLRPLFYGLDFWESLSGELVTIRKPTAVAKANNYGDTWVVGDWRVTGRNSRGGLTQSGRDSNPETILIGSPLDGTKNPGDTKLGDGLAEITGVVTYAFGFYRILPITALNVVEPVEPELPNPTTLISTGKCNGITLGAYNVENLNPTSKHLPAIASHIVEYLKSPDVIFLQEVQDDNGARNDAVTSANLTLTNLANAVVAAGGPQYAFADVAPSDDRDGGAPGGNIRTSYFYKPELIRLYKPNPGMANDTNEVLSDESGPTLKFNPGRIDPTNEAWTASRKPLVAEWEVIGSDGKGAGKFFTVNVHFGSKGGSSSIHGDARPPVNGGVDDRTAQSQLTANFVKAILAKDRNARILTAGDFNEFTSVEPLKQYTRISGLIDADAAAGIPENERYTYLFDMNTQQLDHMFVSPMVARKIKYEHIHINTWVDADSQISDHDPSVALANLCSN